jgi:hypothetical protein
MMNRERSIVRLLTGPLAIPLLLVLLSTAGFATGAAMSQWAARLHPPIGWDRWYVYSERKAWARRELVPDQPGVMRVVGGSSIERVWDASFGTPLSELKSSTPYRLHFRMRSRYEGPISLGISDVEQPFLPRGLVRFFSPASQWQSYDFDFVTTTSDLPASLAIYIAARRFEVDMEDFRLIQRSLEPGEDLVFRPTGWSMVPVMPGGRLTYPATASDPVRFQRRTNDKAPILEYYLHQIPAGDDLEIELQLSATPDQEVDLRIESATRGREVRQLIARVTLKATASTQKFPVNLENRQEPSCLVLDVKQPVADITIHSACWRTRENASASNDPLKPEDRQP